MNRKPPIDRLWRKLDDHGPIRMIACGEGYAMVRRKGLAPFVMPIKKWNKLPMEYPEAQQYDGDGDHY